MANVADQRLIRRGTVGKEAVRRHRGADRDLGNHFVAQHLRLDRDGVARGEASVELGKVHALRSDVVQGDDIHAGCFVGDPVVRII